MEYTQFYDANYVADRYRRCDLKDAVLHYFYQFGEMTLFSPKQGNPVTAFTDTYAEQMVLRNVVTKEQLASYKEKVCDTLSSAADCAERGAEQIYRLVCEIRKQILGSDALEKARQLDRDQPVVSASCQGICEDAQKEILLASGVATVFALYQSQYFAQMRQDIIKAKAAGHRIYLLVSGENGGAMPTEETYRSWLCDLTDVRYLRSCPTCYESVLEGVEWDAALQEDIDQRRAFVFAYGEEALLSCRAMRTDAMIMARPQGYYAKAITNQLGCEADCTVYVPQHLDITAFVPLTEKAQITYWHLATLRRDHSSFVDGLSIEELYRLYPAYFLNRYENGTDCPESKRNFPIQVAIPPEDPDPVDSFDRYREEAIAGYINRLDGVQYQCAYFDPELNRSPIPWNLKEQQEGILVHSVKIKRAKGSRVIRCGKGVTLRKRIQQDLPQGNGIVSNFLFFLTPKLAELYNDLRKDRPSECARFGAEHLDYMLCSENGVRKETFPLFRKTCIAMKNNGEFIFFNFRLGGGRIRVGSRWISWQKQDVDPAVPSLVCVYTPYASRADQEEDRQTYRKAVGSGRVNLVILQDRIQCIRSGDVILPSVGVVVSLEKETGGALLTDLGVSALEDGYYKPIEEPIEIRLDPPAGIDTADWEQIQWAYGGGLSLILEHKAVSDLEDMIPWFEEEGWMSPLSRQTQESSLHEIIKHPRTAIGLTDSGDLLILVFSGRTRLSTGADYVEMCRIARKLYPDVRTLMNADGGGSAVLGLVCQGSFMELSYPSTSEGSTVGMARPIQTALYVAQD